MENIKVSKVYAKAIFDIANSKKRIIEILDMLNALVDQIDKNEDFHKFLEYPIISKDEKIKLINTILKNLMKKI